MADEVMADMEIIIREAELRLCRARFFHAFDNPPRLA
jgi:hypothetical protein